MTIQYGRQSIYATDLDSVDSTLRSDWLTLGPKIKEFESAVANCAGSKYATAVSSGTAALHVAYFAAGIGPGDEIISTPLTFIATTAMAIHLGATVVFADVQEDTGNLDPKKVEELITSKTKAIVAVDFAGHPCDYEQLRKLCDKHGLIFIVDAAHSLNSTYKSKFVGAYADIATFSFFPTKNITTGEGGAIVTSDMKIAERANAYRSHGLVELSSQDKESQPWLRKVEEFGFNYRLSDISAALGISQMKRIDDFKASRKRIFERYQQEIFVDEVVHPTVRPGIEPMWHLYAIRVPSEVRLILFKYLHSKGIHVQVNYQPTYSHPVYRKKNLPFLVCPIAEAYYSSEISLPIHAGLTEAEVSYVIAHVNGFFGAN